MCVCVCVCGGGFVSFFLSVKNEKLEEENDHILLKNCSVFFL